MMRAFFLTVWRHTIWCDGAIPDDEWKYRTLKRVWLPVYDLIAIAIGLATIMQGSPSLNRLFTPAQVDGFGIVFTIVATVCLLGVVFPALWIPELVGKILMVSMIASHAAAIILLGPHNTDPTTVIVLGLAFGLPLPLFRLTLLGEEIKERAAKRAGPAKPGEGSV